MRHPRTYRFLRYAGPAVVVFSGACITLVLSAARKWEGVAKWAEAQFYNTLPVISNWQFLCLSAAIIVLYLAALVYTSGEISSVSQKKHDALKPDFVAPRERSSLVDTIIEAKHRSNQKSAVASIEVDERRRALISAGRDLAAEYTQKGETGFRQFLESSREYLEVRPHLSENYRKKLEKDRTVYVGTEPGQHEPLVRWFLDELDRLERKWGFVDAANEPAPSVPINLNSLGAYMRGYPTMRRISAAIAISLDKPVVEVAEASIAYVEQALALGIPTISELDRRLVSDETLVVRMASYLIPAKLNSDFCLQCLFCVIGGRMGAAAYCEAVRALPHSQTSRETCDQMERIYSLINY